MPLRRLLITAALAILVAPAGATAAGGAAYRPGRVVVGYRARAASAATPAERVLTLPQGETVRQGVRRLRRAADVAYAVPDYVAHIAARRTAKGWDPNDVGRGHGWKRVQWNFLAKAGVDVQPAWASARAAGHPGARGVKIAVLDTGAAYKTIGRYRRSPDFAGTRFVDGYDFVHHDRTPLDVRTCAQAGANGRKQIVDGGWGHGTHVTGTIAEATNNRVGLTGLAYNASIMEVRVLDSCGYGDAATIAKGIRYAVHHHAQVINLSIEFDPRTTADEIPEIISAMAYARRRGVLVVAAAGNDGAGHISYPAASTDALAVGATTDDQCIADYSNYGKGLDLTAPGGGDDSTLTNEPNCNFDHTGQSIYQWTYTGSSPANFGLAVDYVGTSMACPHVTGTAALVIASRVIGAHPSLVKLIARLEGTARDRDTPGYDLYYGYGIVDAGRATSRAVRSSG